MAYEVQSFSTGEVLGADKLNRLMGNIDAVAAHFASSGGPPVTSAGVVHLDMSSADQWALNFYPGSDDPIRLFDIWPSSRTALAPSSLNISTESYQAPLGAPFALVQTNPAGDGLEPVGPLYDRRNLIMNGDMALWQRAASHSTVAEGTYTADRWVAMVGSLSGGSFNVVRDPTVTPPTGFPPALRLHTTDDAAQENGRRAGIEQRIEGPLIRRLRWGTSSAQPGTLSFLAYSGLAGHFCAAVQNAARNRSYVVVFSTAAGSAWATYTAVIPGDTSGTWVTSEGQVGARIAFGFSVGADYQGSADAWTGADRWATSSQADYLATSGAALAITAAQLEVGSARTPFQHPVSAEELAFCRRYYWHSFPPGTAPAQSAGGSGAVHTRAGSSGGRATVTVRHPVQMPATPAITTYNPSAANSRWRNIDDSTDRSLEVVNITRDGVVLATFGDNAGDNDNPLAVHVSADAEL